MLEVGEGMFHEGQDVWVIEPDGSQRAAEYVGQAETSAWFGGPPLAIVVFPDTAEAVTVQADRVIART
jgi:hypothetical protein